MTKIQGAQISYVHEHFYYLRVRSNGNYMGSNFTSIIILGKYVSYFPLLISVICKRTGVAGGWGEGVCGSGAAAPGGRVQRETKQEEK